MATEELRCRLDHDVGTPLHWTTKKRGGKCVVDHEGHTGGLCDDRERFEVSHFARWICDDLGEDRFCVFVDCCTDFCHVIGVDKSSVDPQSAERDVELCHRPSVERGVRHDVVARSCQRGHHEVFGRLSAGARNPSDPAFQTRDSLLERCDRGVGNSSVDRAEFL